MPRGERNVLLTSCLLLDSTISPDEGQGRGRPREGRPGNEEGRARHPWQGGEGGRAEVLARRALVGAHSTQRDGAHHEGLCRSGDEGEGRVHTEEIPQDRESSFSLGAPIRGPQPVSPRPRSSDGHLLPPSSPRSEEALPPGSGPPVPPSRMPSLPSNRQSRTPPRRTGQAPPQSTRSSAQNSPAPSRGVSDRVLFPPHPSWRWSAGRSPNHRWHRPRLSG